MKKIFKTIYDFFHPQNYINDHEMSYANHAFYKFKEKFHAWKWTYIKWTVDLDADVKYSMKFIDNLGDTHVFSDISIVRLNSQFNAHSVLVVPQPYKQSNLIKRFGKRKKVRS